MSHFWLAIRVTEPNNEFIIPRWHKDGNYFASNSITAKFITVLKGPGTLLIRSNKKVNDIYNKISEKEITDKPKIDEKSRNIDEDCIICFEELISRKITNCKICNNCVHSDCLNIWLKSKNTCIFCKSKFEIKNETKHNYINLS